MSKYWVLAKRKQGLRKRVLKRDQGICAVCGKYDAKWEMDHIVALWTGGKDELDNTQTLCRYHHTKKSVSETPIRAKTDRLRERAELTRKRREIR